MRTGRSFSPLIWDDGSQERVVGASAEGQQYRENGFVSAVPILSLEQAAAHSAALEAAEALVGPLHYCDKVNAVLRSPFELATHPAVLNLVEQFTLVRGVDRPGFFGQDPTPSDRPDGRTIERWRQLDRQMKSDFTQTPAP